MLEITASMLGSTLIRAALAMSLLSVLTKDSGLVALGA